MSDVRVFAAGSMTHLMPCLTSLYQQEHSVQIQTIFGPSGSLRAKIEAGQAFDLYLSASTIHTKTLKAHGFLEEINILGFNTMVLLYQADLNLQASDVISTLVSPNISVGMSTTGLDPTSDHEIEVLQKVSQHSGVPLEILEQKTRLITGGRETPNAPTGRNQYGWLMETENVQVLLTYLSNALAAVADNANIRFIELPDPIAVTGTYGIGLANMPTDQARDFYKWLIDIDAQEILRKGGFNRVDQRST